jgi:hypothetical protein
MEPKIASPRSEMNGREAVLGVFSDNSEPVQKKLTNKYLKTVDTCHYFLYIIRLIFTSIYKAGSKIFAND